MTKTSNDITEKAEEQRKRTEEQKYSLKFVQKEYAWYRGK